LEKELITTMTLGSIGVESEEILTIMSENHQGGNDGIIEYMQTQVDDDRVGDNESRNRKYSIDNNGPFVVCICVRERDKQPLELVRLTKFIRAANKSDKALAKKENKLIFLSIGYSTCHWCRETENARPSKKRPPEGLGA